MSQISITCQSSTQKIWRRIFIFMVFYLSIFSSAIEVEKDAINLAIKPENRKEFQDRLQLFKSNKTYIESLKLEKKRGKKETG